MVAELVALGVVALVTGPQSHDPVVHGEGTSLEVVDVQLQRKPHNRECQRVPRNRGKGERPHLQTLVPGA